MKRAKTIYIVVLLCAMISGCSRHQVTEEEARVSAIQRIEKLQKLLNVDPARLPPFVVHKDGDGFIFETWDEKLDLSIVVCVDKYGLAELSTFPISGRLKK